MTPAIQARGLVKNFGATRALDGVDLSALPGTVLGVLGPNGAGKTTAVRILTTLLAPDAGEARVDGFDVVGQAAEVRRRIGLTGQYAAVDDKLTGRENLILIGRLLGLSRIASRQRAGELLGQFALTEAAHRAAQTYSGGMRRRLDLAASLVGRPAILFLDEPTTGLDPRARLQLWALIRQLVAEGTTVLLTTQYLDEADQLADDLAVIDAGRVIATGTPAALKARVGDRALVVRVRNPADIDRLRPIVAELVGAEPQADGDRLTAPVADSGVLLELVRRLDAAAIPVTDLALRQPSLDDVFLALTGRHAAPDDETPA